MFVSIFSRGAICCIERETGRLVWRRPVTKFGAASLYASGTSLLAGAEHSIYSLRPDSGEILWSFCPYGAAGEWIYSSPTLYKKRVYVGDRKGFLHCLDSETGKTIWKRRTSRARNNDVNSTPVVAHGLVIVATNAGVAVAYEAQTGNVAWRQRLDGPSTFGPLLYRGSLAAMAKSLYILDPADGKIRQHFEWKDGRAGEAAATPQGLFVALRPPYSCPQPDPSVETRILLIKGSGAQRTVIVDDGWPHLRRASTTGLVYCSNQSGVDVFEPTTGALLFKLMVTGASARGSVALVDVKENTIYALTGSGYVYALRHP